MTWSLFPPPVSRLWSTPVCPPALLPHVQVLAILFAGSTVISEMWAFVHSTLWLASAPAHPCPTPHLSVWVPLLPSRPGSYETLPCSPGTPTRNGYCFLSCLSSPPGCKHHQAGDHVCFALHDAPAAWLESGTQQVLDACK